MKLQGSGLFHPKTLQSQNLPVAENRLSLNGLEFVHGQLVSDGNDSTSAHGSASSRAKPICERAQQRTAIKAM
jgi:hypothetical protein